ncbi:MAG: prolipoprotein diacylglyceryl transferase [Chthonomonas sp.]|nr:prolipoprotein diacylglyceryl transferase [Chthonomonas sp.]
MLPVLFNIGPVPIRSFGLLMVVAFFVGLQMAASRAKRYDIDKQKVWDLGLWLILCGALGARILFIAQEWKHFSQHTDELFSLQFSGLTSFGGLIGGVLALVIYCRRHKISTRTMLDIFAPALLVSHAIGRVGCLLNGCCHGGPTTEWFGVHQDNLAGLFVPAQLADSAMVLLAWGALRLWENKRQLGPGQAFAFAIIGYNLSRFLFEFFRAGSSSTYWGGLPITQAQGLALAMAILGGILYAAWSRRATGASSPA